MAGQTNTDKVNELVKMSATLIARLDAMEQRTGRLENDGTRYLRENHNLDKRLSLAVRDVERLEKKLEETRSRIEETRSRNWDLWKLFLAALLGGLVSVAAGVVIKSLDRPTPANTIRGGR